MQLQLNLPGVEWLPDRLIINRELEAEELNNVLGFVVRSHDASTWWAGDVLAYIHEKRGEEAAREAARQFRDPLEIWDSMRVCESIGKTRVENVGYKHHRAALDECRGDGKTALNWVLRARAENWEISELRAHIRRSMSSACGQDNSHSNRKLTVTTEIRRFHEALRDLLTSRPITSWSIEECEAFIQDIQPICQIFETIRTRYSNLAKE